MWEKVQHTAKYIKEKTNFTPEYGVILGSGLGSFTNDINIEFTLPYNEIPNFPVSTVEGHKGALVFGTIGSKKSGRDAGAISLLRRIRHERSYVPDPCDEISWD